MIKLEESISAREEGFSCFPSRQCSIRLCSTATTNLSHSSLSRRSTIVLSLSLSLHTQQASQTNPTKIVDDIQPHDLFDQSQISTMVSDHTDHRPRARLTYRYLMYARIYQHKTLTFTSRRYLLHTRIRGSTHRERNDPCKFSNSELNKNEQRSIACGGEFKVKVGYMLGGRR